MNTERLNREKINRYLAELENILIPGGFVNHFNPPPGAEALARLKYELDPVLNPLLPIVEDSAVAPGVAFLMDASRPEDAVKINLREGAEDGNEALKLKRLRESLQELKARGDFPDAVRVRVDSPLAEQVREEGNKPPFGGELHFQLSPEETAEVNAQSAEEQIKTLIRERMNNNPFNFFPALGRLREEVNKGRESFFYDRYAVAEGIATHVDALASDLKDFLEAYVFVPEDVQVKDPEAVFPNLKSLREYLVCPGVVYNPQTMPLIEMLTEDLTDYIKSYYKRGDMIAEQREEITELERQVEFADRTAQELRASLDIYYRAEREETLEVERYKEINRRLTGENQDRGITYNKIYNYVLPGAAIGWRNGEDVSNAVIAAFENKDAVIAQLRDTNTNILGKTLNDIFALVYPGNGDTWEYPGQVLVHIREYIGELKQLAETLKNAEDYAIGEAKKYYDMFIREQSEKEEAFRCRDKAVEHLIFTRRELQAVKDGSATEIKNQRAEIDRLNEVIEISNREICEERRLTAESARINNEIRGEREEQLQALLCIVYATAFNGLQGIKYPEGTDISKLSDTELQRNLDELGNKAAAHLFQIKEELEKCGYYLQAKKRGFIPEDETKGKLW